MRSLKSENWLAHTLRTKKGPFLGGLCGSKGGPERPGGESGEGEGTLGSPGFTHLELERSLPK